ncbi:hypothetical protein IWQ60_007469 [Tieghemiomyces parasiticus]|uniref:Adhesion regulating molecule n=1 Tax=Tieghemiomyces parasiticus TaxID=78921 RepID=A0A9W8DTX8_9FUNG|nr:hypothetical protein IWQ60_007469 [Tieghemiomyces parasiticus]
MASALFSQPPRQGTGSSMEPNCLIQFKAGRCMRDGDTNWVRSDPRKGLAFLRIGDDGLLHFYWKVRRTTSYEEDLIIFPEEAEFLKCTQSEDRVYLLKFKSSAQRLFFWMQGSTPEKDPEVCRRVNKFLNSNVAPADDLGAGSSRRAVGSVATAAMRQERGNPAAGTVAGDIDNEASATLEDVSRTVDHLLGAEGHDLDSDDNASAKATVGSTTTSVVESVAGTAHSGAAGTQAHLGAHQTSGSNPGGSSSGAAGRSRDQSESWAQLRQIMTELQVPDQQQNPSGLDLQDVLTPESLAVLLSDAEVCAALFPYLPEQPSATDEPQSTATSASAARSHQEIREVVQSPPFQHAVRSLSYALQSGQLGPLIQQLGLPQEASFGVENFLRAVETQVKQEKHDSKQGDGSAEQDDGGDSMEEDL